MNAVILAGGKGRRLRPYTAVFPKPLVPIGDRPILEIIIGQLRAAGISRMTLAVGHLASLIQAYFGNGERFGVTIDYSMEDEPLGTAGPLGLLDGIEEDFLVMNGDVLTDLDFRELMAVHRASNAIGTIAVFEKVVHVTLGVLRLDEAGDVVDYDEKPSLRYPVSTGIYCFKPAVLGYLHRGEYCDLPDLVRLLVQRGERVHGYRFGGSWLDIGRAEDYEVAMEWSGGGPA